MSTQLSATFSQLQRLQREHLALGEKLGSAEDHLAAMEAELAAELPPAPPDEEELWGDDAGSRTALARQGKPGRVPPRAAGGRDENPLGDPTGGVNPKVGALLAQVGDMENEVQALRDRRDEVESRIAIFQAWAFEEIPEPLPRSLAPSLRGLLNPHSPESETFRLLRTKFQTIGEERPFRCVGFSSATDKEGKTSTALGLAMSMAQEPGRRILLIEADLRKPQMDSYLGLPRRVGLGEWLQGSIGPVRLRRLEPPGLFLLTAGTSVGQSSELLGSGRMAQLLDVAKQSFDCILLDCPPPFPTADSVILQDLLDGFLFVVRARHTPREMIQAAIGHLRPDSIHGIIFNDHREILPRFYSRGQTTFARRS